MSVSSETSTTPSEEDFTETTTDDELGGSYSRQWFADILAGGDRLNGNINAFGSDGLYVDTDFPLGGIDLQRSVKWKRPKEISPSPQFIVNGATRMDVRQGQINDCWLLSAIASLSMHPHLFERVAPPGQDFHEGYDGSFRFRFWQYGEWEEVKIDDLLPTVDGELLYLSSPARNEFWSSLLEKAYAKLKGGYRALNMGHPHEAMVDMTGGVTEVHLISSLPRDVASFLRHLLVKGALINCANCKGSLNNQNELGIVYRHAYSVTGVEKVSTTNGPVILVRLNNPWGKTEWEGPWSDINGQEWNTVSDEEQRRLERVCREDGEFWMEASDFRRNFDVMEVCHLSSSLSEPGSSMRPWHGIMHRGSWVANRSAGGPPSMGWFWQNPQFLLDLLKEDEDPTNDQKTCSFLVALMQKHHRLRGSPMAIALHIYQARLEGNYLSSLDLSLIKPLLTTYNYAQRREVVLRGRLRPGRYVIIASTSQPNQEGEFILRVLTEKGNAATRAEQPGTEDTRMITEPSIPRRPTLPSTKTAMMLFKKHCHKTGRCRPIQLHRILTEAIKGGVLAGSEKRLALEHCKSLVVLVDSNALGQLDSEAFQNLWEKLKFWTDVFVKFDKNNSKYLEYPEVSPALQAAGLTVDEFVLQLIGLRYTEPNMTISYPGFLFLMMKLDSMIHKFQAFDMVGGGTISLNYKQWLHLTMYN